uniref:Pterin-binding domain-containing protein n=1 Tax=Ascaris lumbricoides TaxID=6252 RepID=A0A0M3I7Q1_ASCLU
MIGVLSDAQLRSVARDPRACHAAMHISSGIDVLRVHNLHSTRRAQEHSLYTNWSFAASLCEQTLRLH